MSPCPANIVPKPQPTPPSNSRRILQAYIFPRTNSAHNQYQKRWHRNMYRVLTKEIRAWRVWEVLDEGVGGSLTMHLQEVLPAARDEQSLTFEETHWLLSAPRGTPRPIMLTIGMIAGPSYVASTNTTDVWNEPKGLKLKHPRQNLIT